MQRHHMTESIPKIYLSQGGVESVQGHQSFISSATDGLGDLTGCTIFTHRWTRTTGLPPGGSGVLTSVQSLRRDKRFRREVQVC